MTGHGGDVVQELTTDHREVEEMFAQIQALPSGSPKRRELVDDVIRELVRHAVAEEAYLYPAARKALPDGDALADHELEEHAEAERTMKELEKLEVTDARFDVLVDTLIRDVRHHITEEEGELFPRLASKSTQEELDKLGDQIRAAKTVAPTRPHPMAPDKPPFNKLLAPGTGLVDRVRDFVSGRNRD
jgi:hemerythrin superfamily protein